MAYRKTIKRIDPRYFLEETAARGQKDLEESSVSITEGDPQLEPIRGLERYGLRASAEKLADLPADLQGDIDPRGTVDHPVKHSARAARSAMRGREKLDVIRGRVNPGDDPARGLASLEDQPQPEVAAYPASEEWPSMKAIVTPRGIITVPSDMEQPRTPEEWDELYSKYESLTRSRLRQMVMEELKNLK